MHQYGVFLEERRHARKTSNTTNCKVEFKLGTSASKLLILPKTNADLGFKKSSSLKIRYTTRDTELQTHYTTPAKV